jgi:DNA-binding NtrC family response regulator
MAHLGTVFLDEVGEMTLRMQGLFLRFLETGEIQKVGDEGPIRHVNVRLIAATNRDLGSMIKQGLFREDLFYRLNVLHVPVPPLRDRREDIPLLAAHFLAQLSAHNGTPTPSLSPDAMQALVEHPWRGNVRELENIIERLVVTATDGRIEIQHVSREIGTPGPVSLRPKRERRRTIADDLYGRIVENGESFWTTAYPLFMDREITRASVREVVRRGLEEARGNYKIVTRLFNLPARDYKRFMSFLRKYDCQIPFKEYR